MLAGINCLFTFLDWHDLKVKTLKLQQQVYCPEEKELTKAEYTRLCRAAERKHNERLCLILQTVCGTGIRVSELQFITVEAARCGEAVVSCKAKTRTVFLVKALRQKLLRYAAEHGIRSGTIFVTRTGKPINRTNLWREMKALCAEAEVNPQKCFLITCATCSHGCFTASKRTSLSWPTFSVTQALIRPVFISSPAARSTDAAWKICGL